MPTTSSPRRRQAPELRLLPVAIACALVAGAPSTHAQPAPNALPVVGNVTRNVTFQNQTGTAANPQMNIRQDAARGLIEWQSFNIGANAKVNIVQPSSQSVLVNRVVNANATTSEIYGALNANGRVFLINPAGVTFGAGAQVNVGSLVASTLDLSPEMIANDYAALLNPATLTLGLVDGSADGRIDVRSGATLTADPAGGGSVVLVGDTVNHGGVIDAIRGRIDIASANAASIALPATTSGFIDLVVSPPARAGGSVQLAENSVTRAEGGAVAVAGDNIRIDGAIDTSAADGGGRITVGGNDTRSLYVGSGATLSADATGNGKGGDIILKALYSNDTGNAGTARVDYGVAEIYGTASARGGVQGGDGGFIETSGQVVNTRLNTGSGTLVGNFDARARAAGAKAGTWLIDPFNVTISNMAPTSSGPTWIPTADTLINAADISRSLDAGTDVLITTGDGSGTSAGDINILNGTTIERNIAGAATSLTLRAHNSIVVDGLNLSTAGNAPVNLNLFSDLGGKGTGNVAITDSFISTGGGNITISGGVDPTTGYARGTFQQAGIQLSGATLVADTGNIVLRGAGAATSSDIGVSVNQTFIQGNNITVLGRSDSGYGVYLNSGNFSTDSGLIDIRGIAERTTTFSAGVVGLNIASSNIAANAGSVVLAGRGDDGQIAPFAEAVGLQYDSLLITTSGANAGSIQIAGEAANSAGAGIAFTDSSFGGLQIRASTSTAIPSLSDVSIGAISAEGLALALGLEKDPTRTSVLTTGSINFRPVNVDTNGNITGAVTERIHVGAALPTAGIHFLIDPGHFGTAFRADSGFVIGANNHAGGISVSDGALSGLAGQSLTLQNQGGGGGIALSGPVNAANLALLSGGNVTQTGPITLSGNLVLGGSGNFALTGAGNQVNGNVALSGAGTVDLLVDGGLTIGDASGMASYDGANNAAGRIDLTASRGQNRAVFRSTNAEIALNHDLSVNTGSDAGDGTVIFVSPVSFNANADAVNIVSNLVQAWSPTVNWEPLGRANYYGCTYPSCTLSGITPAANGNQALFVDRPVLTVVANPATGSVGTAFPPFSYTSTGFINGDGSEQALAGELGTTATSASPAGTYDITQGTLTSPTGYLIQYTNAAFTLVGGATPVPPPSQGLEDARSTIRSAYMAEFRSDVYGRNLALPFICTAQSVIADSVARETVADPLASEWGKVRNQPQLSGCLDVSSGGQCAAF